MIECPSVRTVAEGRGCIVGRIGGSGRAMRVAGAVTVCVRRRTASSTIATSAPIDAGIDHLAGVMASSSTVPPLADVSSITSGAISTLELLPPPTTTSSTMSSSTISSLTRSSSTTADSAVVAAGLGVVASPTGGEARSARASARIPPASRDTCPRPDRGGSRSSTMRTGTAPTSFNATRTSPPRAPRAPRASSTSGARRAGETSRSARSRAGTRPTGRPAPRSERVPGSTVTPTGTSSSGCRSRSDRPRRVLHTPRGARSAAPPDVIGPAPATSPRIAASRRDATTSASGDPSRDERSRAGSAGTTAPSPPRTPTTGR